VRGDVVLGGPLQASPAFERTLAIESVAPNPGADAIRVTCVLPRAAEVRLEVLDAAGRRVATLLAGAHAAGRVQATWDGRGPRGPVPPGVYLLRLAAGQALARRHVVIRR
jgi:hypothetical protein